MKVDQKVKAVAAIGALMLFSTVASAGPASVTLSGSASGFSSADSCETGPIGTQCADGSWYVGNNGADGVRLYAAASDLGSIIRWGVDGTDTAVPNAALETNVDWDGLGNTNILTPIYDGTYDGNRTGTAAMDCDDLAPQGTWYLPSKSELNLLTARDTNNDDTFETGPLAEGVDTTLTNSLAGHIGLNTGTSVYYWSSTETDNMYYVWAQRFSDGSQDNLGKGATRSVRCFRR